MKIKKFDEIVENINIPNNIKVVISFGDDLIIDIDDIKRMDKFSEYENKDLKFAIFAAVEQYLYHQGDMGFTYKLIDQNGNEIKDVNIFKDQKKYNI